MNYLPNGLATALSLLLLQTAATAHAANVGTGAVRIKDLTSWSDGSTIRVYTSDATANKTNPAECQHTDYYGFLRDGKETIYDLLKSAMISGREVSLVIFGGGCAAANRPAIVAASITAETNRVAPSANRGSGGGLVTKVSTNGNDLFYFTTETYTSGPTCSDAGTNLQWAASLNTEMGQAMFTQVMTAFSTGKPISVGGSGNCDVVGDRESPHSLAISD